MKIDLTPNQIDTLFEAIDFWQGSLIGIDDYKTEYNRACKIETILREKMNKGEK